MQTTALVGIGNILFCDEGFGAYVAEYIKENYDYSQDLHVIEGGTLGFGLMPLYLEYDRLIIVGTSSHKCKPGSVTCESMEEILQKDPVVRTANEAEIVTMLEVCALIETTTEVVYLSVVPEDIVSVKTDLTQTLKAAFEPFLSQLIALLEKKGITLTRKAQCKRLDYIIAKLNTPVAQRDNHVY